MAFTSRNLPKDLSIFLFMMLKLLFIAGLYVISSAVKHIVGYEVTELMGWLSKIFKGSSHNVSEGRYDGRYGSDVLGNYPSSSMVNIYLEGLCLFCFPLWYWQILL